MDYHLPHSIETMIFPPATVLANMSVLVYHLGDGGIVLAPILILTLYQELPKESTWANHGIPF